MTQTSLVDLLAEELLDELYHHGLRGLTAANAGMIVATLLERASGCLTEAMIAAVVDETREAGVSPKVLACRVLESGLSAASIPSPLFRLRSGDLRP